MNTIRVLHISDYEIWIVASYFISGRPFTKFEIGKFVSNGSKWLQEHIDKPVPVGCESIKPPNLHQIYMHNLISGEINRKIHELVLIAQRGRSQGFTHIMFS